MSDSRSPRRLLDTDGQDPLARQLLRAGRADGLAPRRAASLVAGAIAAARADEAAGATANSGIRGATRASWTKALAALVPVLGLAAVSYSITSPPAPPNTSSDAPAPVSPAVSAIPADPVAAPPPPPQAAAIPSGPVATPQALVGPGDLPDAKGRPATSIARPPSPGTSQPSRAGEGTFEAELALLTQVTSALDDKRPARALALIDEHDRRFPNGVLAPEFAGERVLTLAALGRHAEACAHATKFLATYPKSPFVPEVRSLCADSTSDR